jgi:hypothetical protein
MEIYRDTFAALAATGRASPYDEIVEAAGESGLP